MSAGGQPLPAGREAEAPEEEAGAAGLVEAGSGAGAQEEAGHQPSQATTPSWAGGGFAKRGPGGGEQCASRRRRVPAEPSTGGCGDEGGASFRGLAISRAAPLMPSLPLYPSTYLALFLSSLAISRAAPLATARLSRL